ncbi:MAG: hypothetical protein ACXWRE_14215, partial [Pseudobdellovibrionaceae bacterium]
RYRMGCFEKWLIRPPTACRQAWQDSEYSHSSAALLESRILSSLHVMELILEVEKIKGTKFNLKNIKPGAFNSIDNIYNSFFGNQT